MSAGRPGQPITAALSGVLGDHASTQVVASASAVGDHESPGTRIARPPGGEVEKAETVMPCLLQSPTLQKARSAI